MIVFTHNWPVFLTSSTAAIISTLMSGFSLAISSPLAIKFSVAFCTAALKTWAFFDLPFFLLDGLFWFTKVVTYKRISKQDDYEILQLLFIFTWGGCLNIIIRILELFLFRTLLTKSENWIKKLTWNNIYRYLINHKIK